MVNLQLISFSLICLRISLRFLPKLFHLKSSAKLGDYNFLVPKELFERLKIFWNERNNYPLENTLFNWEFSNTATRWILTDDSHLHSYKKNNWIYSYRCRKGEADTMRIIFSDEKMFAIDGVYNVQNDRIWTVDGVEADTKWWKIQRRMFP